MKYFTCKRDKKNEKVPYNLLKGFFVLVNSDTSFYIASINCTCQFINQ